MYNLGNISEPTPITKDNILRLISEEDIMRYYVGFEFEVGRAYRSPLREDSSPSFALYYTRQGSIRFKDFNGDQGNCFDFVILKTGLNFIDSLKLIVQDFNLNLGTNTPTVFPKEVVSVYKPKVVTKDRLIQFKPQQYTNVDKQYWSKYGLGRVDLEKYNVFSAQFIYLDKQLIGTYSTYNPIYCYKFNGKHVKVYRPLSTASGKWLSNVDEKDLQGFEQLDMSKEDLIIITKSLKDVMCLNKMGYQAVAPQSENTRTQYELIQKVSSYYDKVVILFDNDEAGKRGAQSLAEYLGENCKCIYMPNDTKDISDYIVKYGIDNASTLLKDLL